MDSREPRFRAIIRSAIGEEKPGKATFRKDEL